MLCLWPGLRLFVAVVCSPRSRLPRTPLAASRPQAVAQRGGITGELVPPAAEAIALHCACACASHLGVEAPVSTVWRSPS